ncbi:hypothetical protein [Geobacter sp. SVR]|uniref:hypothetical protein n=1 Tax=Geobacter sp. SVR TaxID=2495594 RepID=UPI00143EFB79|nr:hypothetical protein [Geobacter sp. SVR]BCS52634.1 hypothetical protein GSVR_09420 [Geobacter sp. SVR]GCF83929.1 hypothetical protein GSbR_05290 [Geobacter sp. SVR]
MARTAEKTAQILTKLYNQQFDQDSLAPFRISWPQLRSIMAVPRLDEGVIGDINAALSECGQALVPLSNFLLMAREDDFEHYRMLPDRIVERFIPDIIDTFADDDDQELEAEE